MFRLGLEAANKFEHLNVLNNNGKVGVFFFFNGQAHAFTYDTAGFPNDATVAELAILAGC